MRLTLVIFSFCIIRLSCAAYCPAACICTITVTNCSNSNLTTVPVDIDRSVEVLDLSHNHLQSAEFLYDLPYLKRVNLSYCGLVDIDFTRPLNIEEIDLSYNAFKSVYKIKVNKLEKLKVLNLSNNGEINVLANIASNSLEVLDLSNSNIYAIEKRALTGLRSLKKLLLRQTPLKRLTYIESSTLIDLDVSNGSLNLISSDNLLHLPRLVSLDASQNSALRLSMTLPQCSHLERADFSETGCSEINLNTLCYIEDINISVNSITHIFENSLSQNTKLLKMNISYNNIEKIHKNAFSNNTEIRTLDLVRNRISETEWCWPLVNLLFLNLSSNKITDLNSISLPKLTFLDASSNDISSLNLKFIDNIPNIQYLDLSNNRINHITPLISNTLITLKLSFCQITSFNTPVVFSELKQLKFLDLEGNKLTKLDYIVLENVGSLQDVRLGQNPWSCNCKKEYFRALYQYIVVNQSLTNANDLICAESEKGTWFEACSEQWKYYKSDNSVKAVATVIGLFVLSLIGVCMLVFLRHRAAKHRIETPQDVASTPASVSSTQRFIRRAHSEADIINRGSDTSNQRESSNQPPPTYEEALLLPPMSEVERMTRSMDLLQRR